MFYVLCDSVFILLCVCRILIKCDLLTYLLMIRRRSIIKTDASPLSSSLQRGSLPGYDHSDAAIGRRPGGGAALLEAPPSFERKRKTVRMSDAHQYYSDYNDADDW